MTHHLWQQSKTTAPKRGETKRTRTTMAITRPLWESEKKQKLVSRVRLWVQISRLKLTGQILSPGAGPASGAERSGEWGCENSCYQLPGHLRLSAEWKIERTITWKQVNHQEVTSCVRTEWLIFRNSWNHLVMWEQFSAAEILNPGLLDLKDQNTQPFIISPYTGTETGGHQNPTQLWE